MKASKKKIGVSVVSCLIMIGCGVNEDLEMQESVDEVAMSLESGLVVIGGVADDSSDKSISSSTAIDGLSVSSKAVCSQLAVVDTCQSGIKSATYDECQPLDTLGSLGGNVQLRYSQSNCALDLS